jgi:DTW domain-containing protein YfiP
MEILLIRHFREAHRSSNSARLAPLLLQGCEVVDFGLVPLPSRLELPRPGDWLLFAPEPGQPAPSMPPGPPPRRLILLDGTWGQTRRMAHRIPGLMGLPRLCLGPASPRDRLREGHSEWARATLEALGDALQALGEPAGPPVQAAYDLFVRRSRLVAGRRSGHRGISTPSGPASN